MEGHEILPEHLPYELQVQKDDASVNQLSLASVEKIHIQKILLYSKGNKTRAAEVLGIGLTTLYRKLQEYGLNHWQYSILAIIPFILEGLIISWSSLDNPSDSAEKYCRRGFWAIVAGFLP